MAMDFKLPPRAWLIVALLWVVGCLNHLDRVIDVTDPRYRATGYGVLKLFSRVIGGPAIFAGGLLRDFAVDVSRVFQIAAVTILVAAGLLYCIKPQATANL